MDLGIAGQPSPDIKGVYVETGTHNDQPAYYCAATGYWIWFDDNVTWIVSETKGETEGVPSWTSDTKAGLYAPDGVYAIGASAFVYAKVNLAVSGAPAPDCVGIYEENGESTNRPKWIIAAGDYKITFNNSLGYGGGWMLYADTGVWGLNSHPDDPYGTYTPLSNATGNIVVGDPFAITASSGANGVIDPAGAIEVPSGEDQIFTAVPAAGYEVNQWTIDGSIHTGGTIHTLVNVTAAHTISVTFSALAARHLCTLADVKTRLGLTNTDFDDIIYSIIVGVDGLFENEAGWPLLMTDEDAIDYYSMDDFRQYLMLNQRPIISVTSIKEASDYDFTAATALIEDVDYRLVNKGLNGIIYRINAQWLAGVDVIEVKGRCGYCGAGETPSTGEHVLPNELREDAITQAAFLFKRKDDIGLSSVSSQGGSINKFADIELLPLVKKTLNSSKYKRPSL